LSSRPRADLAALGQPLSHEIIPPDVLSMQAIADRLNDARHVTRTGLSWSATQIKRIPDSGAHQADVSGQPNRSANDLVVRAV